MGAKSLSQKAPAEWVVKDIRRATPFLRRPGHRQWADRDVLSAQG